MRNEPSSKSSPSLFQRFDEPTETAGIPLVKRLKLSRGKMLALGLALSVFAGATFCQAITIGQYYIHTPGTIRDTKSAFVIGRMDSSWGHAFIKQPASAWSWGYMSGAGICGWIQNTHIPYKKDNSTWGDCPAPPPDSLIEGPHRVYLLNNYASEVNDYNPGNLKHWGKHINLKDGSWPVYGNYFNGGIRHQIGTITKSKYVSWRYIAKYSNNGYVLISYANDSKSKGTWGFISMAALSRPGYPTTVRGVWCDLPHSF